VQSEREYDVARAASYGYCVRGPEASPRELEEELWPRMQGDLSVPLEVFRVASRHALQELNARDKSLVLDNEECATLLSQARSSTETR
jgi:hypothetical protein